MAQAGKPGIADLLNGTSPGPQPSPAPEQFPTTPPSPPPPPPPRWPTPAAPTPGGSGTTIKYETAALRQFAGTSDERAASFQKAQHTAQGLKLGGNAFGIMFGQLCRAAYDQQVQDVTSGCAAGQAAMTSIAQAMRASADAMDSANQAIAQSAAQANG